MHRNMRHSNVMLLCIGAMQVVVGAASVLGDRAESAPAGPDWARGIRAAVEARLSEAEAAIQSGSQSGERRMTRGIAIGGPHYERADAIYEEILAKLNDARARALAEAGWFRFVRYNDRELAIAMIEEAHALRPDDLDTSVMVAAANYWRGQQEEAPAMTAHALEIIEGILGKDPNHGYALYLGAQIAIRSRQPDIGLDYLRRLLAVPDHLFAAFFLFDTQEIEDRIESAKAQVEVLEAHLSDQ